LGLRPGNLGDLLDIGRHSVLLQTQHIVADLIRIPRRPQYLLGVLLEDLDPLDLGGVLAGVVADAEPITERWRPGKNSR